MTEPTPIFNEGQPVIPRRPSDIYMSKEAMDDIKNWPKKEDEGDTNTVPPQRATPSSVPKIKAEVKQTRAAFDAIIGSDSKKTAEEVAKEDNRGGEYRSSTAVPHIKPLPSDVMPDLAKEFGATEFIIRENRLDKLKEMNDSEPLSGAYEEQLWRASRKYCKTKGVTQAEAREILINDPALCTEWANK